MVGAAATFALGGVLFDAEGAGVIDSMVGAAVLACVPLMLRVEQDPVRVAASSRLTGP